MHLPLAVLSQIALPEGAALDVPPHVLQKGLLTLLVLAGVYLLRRVVMRVVDARLEEPRARYQASKVSGYVAFVVLVIGLGGIWLEGLTEVGTFLGLLTAGLAIALRDLVADLAGWLFILLRRPFQVGDRIEIGGFRGDVVDIRAFQFSLLEIGNWVHADQSTGRVIHVPNARVLTDPLANYTAEFPYIWHEIEVLVTFESDWRKARAIVERVVAEVTGETSRQAQERIRRASGRLLISFRHLGSIVYLSVRDSGVLLTARFLVEPRSRRGHEKMIWEGILDAFDAEPDVELAYPTFRVTGVPEEPPARRDG
ncbi:MAG: mechanosensitive ion channel family protein [Gemmatimonadetes bacterium]|nr:MAG: mechanosensitive ion channel family protein [Gemmatimonadota bacterium]